MTDFLQWALSDFWRFLGLVILILIVVMLQGFAAIVGAFRR